MDDQFHQAVGAVPITADEFAIPRAKALHAAVLQSRDYTLVELFRLPGQAGAAVECIVVDVECDGVPPNNTYGIKYRERLSLCVSADPKQLIEVLALRREFPTLIHQNHTPLGAPASLCLYFEPPAAVMRTWTPHKFLRRIQWWIEESAKGTLHPADQPVEQLFFVGKYELVLPWNFDEVQNQPGTRFAVTRSGERQDGGQTFFLHASPASSRGPSVAPIELNLPAVVQGHVERDPRTLGELVDTFSSRGVDVIAALASAVERRIDERGAAQASDDPFSILLLHVPISRTAGSEPERIAHRAFLIQPGALRLGELIGTLFALDGKYFSAVGVLGDRRALDWRSQPLSPMEILRMNDSARARAQSGHRTTGPRGVLIGAGALGSTILQLWGRSGWGSWTVIEKDHLRPHNLARHVGYAHQVGHSKADVVAQLHEDLAQGDTRVTALSADATNLSDAHVSRALKDAELVVDVSTTLEYPRLASEVEGIGRHVTIFVTPDGSGAVLLAEDATRSIRLRSLESQYYRAVIEQPWGANHLDGSMGSFWSGAGCRDISAVLPYARVVTYAGTLAEQVERVATNSAATIRVWRRSPDLGSIEVCEVTPCIEEHLVIDGTHIYFDCGLERKLQAMRAQALPSETGGVLLGYHDLNVNAIVLVDALSAPTDSIGTPAFFERGVEGLLQKIGDASKRTAGIVGYVGEWHSHPRRFSTDPSGLDLRQLAYLTLGMAEEGLPALSVIVGDEGIRVMKGSLREDTSIGRR